jgi:mannose-6-phosphate isomerase-like protein (cupin superfamily)
MNSEKQKHFLQQQQEIEDNGFSIVDKDEERPWGGFFVIDEQQASKFANHYFENQSDEDLNKEGKLSPKILMVQPDKRLSWQYHHRRAEVWSIVEGPVGVILSDTDEQNPLEMYSSEDVIHIDQEERHRLVGLESWGVVAEIWQHTDPDNPSNEDDIVRVQDDFGR